MPGPLLPSDNLPNDLEGLIPVEAARPAPPRDGADGVNPHQALSDLLDTLERRRWVLVATLLLVLGGVAAWTFYQVPTYRATTSLMVEQDLPQLAGYTGAPAALREDFTQTQLEVIRSDSVLAHALEALGLAGEPEYLVAEDPVAVLRGKVIAQPVRRSRLLRIQATDADRAQAVAIADAVADAYIAHNQQQRRSTSRNAFDSISVQLDALKAKVEDAERSLLDYRHKEDVVSIERRQELLEERIADLSSRDNQAQTRTMELATMLAELRKLKRQPELVDSLPKILDNALVRSLKEELSQLHVQQARLAKRYRPKHPDIVSLQSQVEDLQRRLALEVDKIYRSVQIEHSLSSAKAETIAGSLIELREESMQLADQAIRFNVLKREAESNRKHHDVLLELLATADISGHIGGQNVRVLDRAKAPSSPHSPRVTANLAFGAVAGLLLGIALSMLSDLVDRSVRDEREVQESLGETLLGSVPRLKGGVSLARSESQALLSAYRDVRTALRLYARGHMLRSVLISSGAQSDGKTVTTACLGIAFARSGLKTLIIDADMFKASLGRFFGVPQETAGLSDHLVNGVPVGKVLRKTKIENLTIVPAGLIPPDPSEPLGSPAFRALLTGARERYDIVLIDSPPVNAALDVAFLGGLVDGVVMVVRAGSSPRVAVKRALHRLRHGRGNLLGVVLTAAERKGAGYGYYDYYGNREGKLQPVRAQD